MWQRLLAGELTEVYSVAGADGFQAWTLGLEPISVNAYRYDRADGMPVSDARREEIARQLSAQRYWTVVSEGMIGQRRSGVVMAWDRHFADRAQIALIVLKPRRSGVFLRAALAALRPRRETEFAFSADVDDDRAQVEFYKALRYYSLYCSPRYGPTPPYSFVVAQYLLEKYPDKTFVVSNPRQIKQLRSLRIPRERQQDR